MPVLTTLAAFSTGTADGAGSSSATRQVQAETAALANGVEYLVLYEGGAIRDGTHSTVTFECDVQVGGTVHAHAHGATQNAFDPPEGGTNVARCAGFTFATGNGTDTVSIGTRRSSAPGSASVLWSGGGVKAIPLDSLTENTHYWRQTSANDDTALVTPASASGWVAFGTPVSFTAGTTGEFLALFAGEAQFQSDAGASDVIRVRFRLTRDTGGSPVTETLGAGDNSGELSPAIHLYAPASTPEDFIRHFRFEELVQLTSGTGYSFFMEVEALSGGGDTEYRKARTVVFDGSAWAGGITQNDTTLGEQPSNGTSATYGPLSIASPSPATHEYTFLGGTSFTNNDSWHRAWFNLNGTRFPATGGWGSGGYNNGVTTSDDFHWLSFLAEDDVSAAYDASIVVLADNSGGDCPSGFAHGESGGDATDPAILSRVIAWRMETDVVSAVTGTLARTLGAVTSSSAGDVDVVGTLARTLGAVTSSSAGDVDVVGTLARTLGPATLVSAGIADAGGTLAATLGDVTLAGVGVSTIEGTLAATLADVTLASAGDVDVVGTLGATLGAATLASAGSVDVVGTSAPTLDAATLASSGTVDVDGTASVTLGAATLASAGTVTDPVITGTLTATLGAATLSSAGAVDVVGTTARTLDDATATSVGVVLVAGTLARTLEPATLSSAGTVGDTTITGTLSATLGAATLSSAGTVDVAGTFAITLDAATLSSAAAVDVVGSVAVTLDAATVASAATAPVMGTLAVTLDAATLASVGSTTLATGTLAQTLADVTVASAGSATISIEAGGDKRAIHAAGVVSDALHVVVATAAIHTSVYAPAETLAIHTTRETRAIHGN